VSGGPSPDLQELVRFVALNRTGGRGIVLFHGFWVGPIVAALNWEDCK
jgi:hypothetical protein